MADFCKQCSIDLFGSDSHDLAGIGTRQGKTLGPDEGWPAICEGCGFILVDDDGNCIQCDLMGGKPGHGERWVGSPK